MSIFNKIRLEFKPFVDDGSSASEITDRVRTLSNGRGHVEFNFEDGFIIVWGVIPQRMEPIRSRLPSESVMYEGIDMSYRGHGDLNGRPERCRVSLDHYVIPPEKPSKPTWYLFVPVAVVIVVAILLGALA